MHQYLFIFFVLFVTLSLSNNTGGMTLAGKQGKTVFVACFVVLGLLAALRSPIVGNDTKEYIRIFEDCQEMIDNETRFELGYLYYNLLIHNISNNYQLLFIITSFFIFTTFGIFTWHYSDRPKLALLFFFILVFPSTVNTIRQCMATCILLYSLVFILKRRLFIFILLVVIASFFHITSLLFLVVYPLSYLKINKRIVLLFVVATFVCYILFADLLQIGFSYYTMYEYYTQGKYFEGETRVASMVKLAFSMIVFSFAYFAYERTTKGWKQSKEGMMRILIMMMKIMKSKMKMLQ